jgi:hypothetical protein
VTRRSIVEYANAVRGRYQRATKKQKTLILNEFVANTGMHRKAAIRLLNYRDRKHKKRRGRPRLYGLDVMAELSRQFGKSATGYVPDVCSLFYQNYSESCRLKVKSG